MWQRDVKGLYKKACTGKIPFFVGIDSLYEIPEYPELITKTDSGLDKSIEEVFNYILEHVKVSAYE